MLLLPSSTSTVNIEEPAVAGVPEIVPPELSIRPGGRLPDCRLNV